MAHAEIADGKIGIWSEWREKELARQIPGSSWDPTSRIWHAPLSWGTCKVLRGVFGTDMTVGPDLAQWAWDELNDRINPTMKLRTQVEMTPNGPDPYLDALLKVENDLASSNLRLYPFQRTGALFLARAGLALLADEMGTGKTIQTIVALRILHELNVDVFPVLVVCPNSMKVTWCKEFTRWWPNVKTQAISGGAQTRRKQFDKAGHQVVVMNWDSMRRHSRLAPYGSTRLTPEERMPKELNRIPWKTVIADEAHKLKNPQAKWTRAVWAVGHQDTVIHRFALTGTPLADAPDDTWGILHFIDKKDWPAKTKYVDRYCLISWNAFGGMEVMGIRPETKEEFFEILDPRMRRMPKELVLPHLPKKTHQKRYVKLGQKQRRAYDQMEHSMIAMVDDGTVFATNPLTRLTRLVQFSSAFATINEEDEVRLTDPSCKLDEMVDIMDDLGDAPVVIAAESRQLIEMAAVRLDALQKARIKARRSPTPYSYRKIVGGMTDDQREVAKSDFQEGRSRALLFTMKAGGVGLTFTRAGHAIFLQRSWSSIDNRQAEDRVHRIGSEIHDKVIIIDIIAEDTVEEGQLIALSEKGERLEEIVRDRELLRGLFTK